MTSRLVAVALDRRVLVRRTRLPGARVVVRCGGHRLRRDRGDDGAVLLFQPVREDKAVGSAAGARLATGRAAAGAEVP